MEGAQVHAMHPPGPHTENGRVQGTAGTCSCIIPGMSPDPCGLEGRGVGRSPHLPIRVHSWFPEVLQAQALTVVHHHHHLNLLAQLGQEDGGDQAGLTGRSRDGVVSTG